MYTGVPIIAANMDTVGTFEMAKVLCKVGLPQTSVVLVVSALSQPAAEELAAWQSTKCYILHLLFSLALRLFSPDEVKELSELVRLKLNRFFKNIFIFI